MFLSNEIEIHTVNETISNVAPPAATFKLSRNLIATLGGGFLVLDFLCVFVALAFVNAGNIATGFIYTLWLGVSAAILAPLILYHQNLGVVISRASLTRLSCSHLLRFGLFTVAIVMIVSFSATPEMLPPGWLTTWLLSSLLLTWLSRIVVFATVRHLQRRGALRQTIALVGVGPAADRLVHELGQSQANQFELLGVFDDKIIGASPGKLQSSGNLAQLIELGKTRDIDWILLTLPPTAVERLQSIVGRLKALSVPIGICSQQLFSPQSGTNLPHHTVDFIGEKLAVNLLSRGAVNRWEPLLGNAESVLPRWIVTTALLPIILLADKLWRALPAPVLRGFAHLTGASRTKARRGNIRQTFQFDNYDIDEFTSVAADFGQDRFGYVVTPNVDHMIRLHDEALFRDLYTQASYVLLDSRFFSHLLRLRRGLKLPVCTGSDLTASLFAKVITPSDRIVMVGGSDLQADQVRKRYGLQNLSHYNPPMGFIKDPQAVKSCLQFIEANSPFRFCFLAVGAPQQEMVAQQLKARGLAHGLALCIGASINFITGDEQRAPSWMQQAGMEWLFRLLQAPRRMAKRYLIKGPRIFALLQHTDIILRDRNSGKAYGINKTPPVKVGSVQPGTMPVQEYANSSLILESERSQLAAAATRLAPVRASDSEILKTGPSRHTRVKPIKVKSLHPLKLHPPL